jgi:zinc transport system substrate-binding protein
MRALALLALLPAAALAEAPLVVTDIAPVHALAARVMQGVGSPVLLVGPGGDVHSWQLRPSQARSLSQADLVFWIGPTLTPWLDTAIEGLADPGAAVELAAAAGVTARPPLFVAAHDHDHGSFDPHVWLDPANAAAMLTTIADDLARTDPDNEAAYRANAEAARDELAALDAELAAELEPLREEPFVVFHDAYAHLAGRYGLSVAGALAETDAAGPGAAHVAALRDLVDRGQVACVFAEALHDERLLLAAAEGTGVGLGSLDPEGSTLPPGPDLYPQMMRALAASIAGCLAAH